MADLTYIPALNGEEIIQDICGALAEKLRSDCNLRQIDGYSGGYRASISGIHIEAFGLDSVVLDYSLKVDETGPGQDANNPVDLDTPYVLIDTELEIPVEEDLSLVRERSGQIAGDFEAKPTITEDGPVVPQKRKYTRRLKALVAAQGGAAGPLDE